MRTRIILFRISSIFFFIFASFFIAAKAQVVDSIIKIDYTYEINENNSNTINNLSNGKKDNRDMPFIRIEQKPQFSGGNVALLKYIKNNLKPINPLVEGRVVVRSLIEKDSIVKDVKVIRSLSKEADVEAIRVVESMPKWIPGQKNGVNIPVYFT